jgi:hypothetical protein
MRLGESDADRVQAMTKPDITHMEQPASGQVSAARDGTDKSCNPSHANFAVLTSRTNGDEYFDWCNVPKAISHAPRLNYLSTPRLISTAALGPSKQHP